MNRTIVIWIIGPDNEQARLTDICGELLQTIIELKATVNGTIAVNNVWHNPRQQTVTTMKMTADN